MATSGHGALPPPVDEGPRVLQGVGFASLTIHFEPPGLDKKHEYVYRFNVPTDVVLKIRVRARS